MLKTFTEISKTTECISNRLIDIRRYLHQHPETAGNEARTSEIIAIFLQSLGLEVRTGLGGYGVVGILRGGLPGKAIAWRADIDAFETDFPDVVDFQSNIMGVRHICGHDVHIAIGLGIAEVLNSHKKEIEGTIAFIFQPAEENYTGAARMIGEGILDELKPEAIFALHVAPLPTGTISIKAGEIFSVKKKIKILLNNQGNMNAIERECKHLMECIPTITDLDYFSNYDTFADVKLGLFSPDSIYKDYIITFDDVTIKHSEPEVSIEGYFFGSNEKNLINALEELKESLSKKEWKNCIKSVGFSFEKPIVNNDRMLTEVVVDKIKSISSSDPVIQLYGVIPGNDDDFSFFQQKVPGVYFFLGGSDNENGITCAPHSPNFAVDEKCIEFGVNIFSSMMIEYLRHK